MGYLDHIDPGNAGGSVKVPDNSRLGTPIEPVFYACKVCGALFPSTDLVNDHRIKEHPIRRPTLLINGTELRSDTITLRTKIVPSDISFQDVDSVYLDDKLVESEEQLLQWLCNSTPAAFNLKLVNQNYPVSFRWTIDIADSDELDQVDVLFFQTFQTGLSMYQEFGLFNEKAARLSSAARHYAAGLSCYVTGVMAKDQLPGVSLPFEKHSQKLGEAMDILNDYRGRALPDSIFSIVEFMLNNFTPSPNDHTLPKLFYTKRFFGNGLFRVTRCENESARPIPIDMETEAIVDFCSEGDAYRAENASKLEALVKSAKAGSSDRAKIGFVLWSYYRDRGATEKAQTVEKKLTHHPYFGSLIEMIKDV